ncbi:MAG: HDOD domain-containing protein [Deltaproteobacteria bacterium]|jgi:HD-like signal output (HDOD) protein|nr:HDOD domain-containing protein [Deltaproteobacteria bacterium]
MATRINEAHDFLNDLAVNPPRLPFDPAILPQLFRGMADDSLLPMSELAALIERSQALAAKVLSVANSACYGLQGNISSLTRAAQVLGVLELRSLVLFFSATGAIPRSNLPREFPCRDLWEHQVRTALLAQAIAQLVNTALPKAEDCVADSRSAPSASPDFPVASVPLDADGIYTAGLLHDLGKVVLGARRAQVWQEISEISRKKQCEFAMVEEDYWGIDHGTVAAILLKTWDLPDLLTEMINWHHHPNLCSDYKLEVHILAAANKLAVQGMSDDGKLPPDMLDILPQYADLLSGNTDKLQQALTDEKAKTLAAFA